MIRTSRIPLSENNSACRPWFGARHGDMLRALALACAAFLIVSLPIASHAARFYIAPTAAGNGSGSSWANARTLDSYLTQYNNNMSRQDELWLKIGDHFIGAANRPINLKTNMKIIGDFVGNETSADYRNIYGNGGSTTFWGVAPPGRLFMANTGPTNWVVDGIDLDTYDYGPGIFYAESVTGSCLQMNGGSGTIMDSNLGASALYLDHGDAGQPCLASIFYVDGGGVLTFKRANVEGIFGEYDYDFNDNWCGVVVHNNGGTVRFYSCTLFFKSWGRAARRGGGFCYNQSGSMDMVFCTMQQGLSYGSILNGPMGIYNCVFVANEILTNPDGTQDPAGFINPYLAEPTIVSSYFHYNRKNCFLGPQFSSYPDTPPGTSPDLALTAGSGSITWEPTAQSQEIVNNAAVDGLPAWVYNMSDNGQDRLKRTRWWGSLPDRGACERQY